MHRGGVEGEVVVHGDDELLDAHICGLAMKLCVEVMSHVQMR